MNADMQLLLNTLTIAGAIFGSYLGVRLALTRLQGKVENLSKEIARLDSYIVRMEDQMEKRFEVIEQRCFQALAAKGHE